MNKLNRAHGIEVGSIVKVIDGSGASFFNDKVGQTFTVTAVKVDYPQHDEYDLIEVEGNQRASQYATRFELVTLNGVDANGNPLNFTRADLKSLMRVVLADGTEGIIAETGFGEHYGTCVVYDTAGKSYGSFDPAYVESHSNYPLVVEVYENPGFGNMYKQGIKGDLIWKAVDVVKLQAVKAADEAVAKAEAELEAARAARAAL